MFIDGPINSDISAGVISAGAEKVGGWYPYAVPSNGVRRPVRAQITVGAGKGHLVLEASSDGAEAWSSGPPGRQNYGSVWSTATMRRIVVNGVEGWEWKPDTGIAQWSAMQFYRLRWIASAASAVTVLSQVVDLPPYDENVGY